MWDLIVSVPDHCLSFYFSISVLDITSTDSRHNGKCNICAFHEEIHTFEDWIFCQIIKSSSCF